jgi:hypothetical protein
VDICSSGKDRWSALVYMAWAFAFYKMYAIYWLTKKLFFSPGSAPSVTLDYCLTNAYLWMVTRLYFTTFVKKKN